MKVIRNKILPFGRGMIAINLFGVIFAKRELDVMELNHEYIHTLQQRELWFVGFFVLYVIEWLYHSIRERSLLKGYFAISFEREAYANQWRLRYRNERKRFAWSKYFCGSKNINNK